MRPHARHLAGLSTEDLRALRDEVDRTLEQRLQALSPVPAGSIRQAYLRSGVMPHPRGRTLAELRRSAAEIDREIGDLIGTI